MTERHTIFREPCLGCDVCQARALSNLPRPNNVNLLVVAGFIVYKNYQNMPKFDPYTFFTPMQRNGIFVIPYTKKHFRDPLSKKQHFQGPLYKKLVFSRPPYTTKWHFRDVLYKKVPFSWPPIKENGLLRTPYKYIFPFWPSIQNGQNLTPPIQKMNQTWPPYEKNCQNSTSR